MKVKKIKNILKKFPSAKFFIPVFIIITILAVAFGLYFFNQYQKSQELIKNPTLAETKEVQELLIKIGKLIILPKGENPSIATVTDVTKLNNQPFFSNAQNGDKVLFYKGTNKAIVYRPSQNIIVEVGAISLENEAISSSPSANISLTPNSEKAKLTLYNATSTSGLTKVVEERLKGKFPNIDVVGRGNAEGTYEKTLIISLNENFSQLANDLASELGGEVGNMPQNEEKPDNSDILIILGK